MNDVMGRWEPSVCPHPQTQPYWRKSTESRSFTQKAAVSHEASGQRRSPLTDSSSQTTSVKSQTEHRMFTPPLCQDNPRRDTNTRGCCCARLHTLIGTFFQSPPKLQYLSSGFKRNAHESAVCLRWTYLDIDTFALALQTNCTVTNSLRFHCNRFLMRWKMPAACFLKLRRKSMWPNGRVGYKVGCWQINSSIFNIPLTKSQQPSPSAN